MQEWLATQFACAARTWLNSGSDPLPDLELSTRWAESLAKENGKLAYLLPSLIKAILFNRSESGKCFSPMNSDLVSVWITDGRHVARWHVHWADDNRNVVLAKNSNR